MLPSQRVQAERGRESIGVGKKMSCGVSLFGYWSSAVSVTRAATASAIAFLSSSLVPFEQ